MGDRKKRAEKWVGWKKKGTVRGKKHFSTQQPTRKKTGRTMGGDNDGENNNLLHGCYVTEAGYGVQGRLGGEIGGVIDVGEDGIQQSTS